MLSLMHHRVGTSLRALAIGVSTMAMVAATHAAAQDSSPQAPAVKADAQGGTLQPTAPVTNTQDGGISRSTSPAISGAPAPDVAEGQQPTGQDPVAAAAEEATGDDIVVTGIRASLANAQSIKRDSDTVVDAITAQDIGALPDRSVTEALQRVPGVTISRFAAANDPDHFSSEGSGIVVRGLNYVRSEFNGRDTFSANGGRSLNFADVSPELLGSVEVFKNLTSDMIEGGIAGTVNLNTRKPFDTKESQQLYLSADMNFADLIDRGGPAVSGLYLKNFDTSVGRFGLLVGGSYSQLFSRADGIQVTNYQQRFNGSRDVNGDGVAETDNFPGLAAGQLVYAPVGAGQRIQEFNRERIGAAAALQYQSNDDSLLATFQFVRSDARQTWGERTFETLPDGIDRATGPAAGSRFTFDDRGVFQSGTISQNRGFVPAGGEQFGMLTQLATRGVKSRGVTDDFGGNVKWQATDRLSFNADAQYVRSTNDVTDFSVFGTTFADVALDTTGNIPQVEFIRPSGTGSNAAYFADPTKTYFRAAMDQIQESDGDQYSFRGDATYQFADDSFLRAIKVGGRYANREQTVRSSLYNWAVLSETWAGSGPVTAAETPAGVAGLYGFTNIFRGDGPSTTNGFYLNGNLADNYVNAAQAAKAINAQWVAKGGLPGWTPLGERAGVIAGTPFLPSETYTNTEITKAGYARLDFGGGDTSLAGLRISGNVGLRYVHTLDKADGFFTYPTRTQIISSAASAAAFCAQPSQTSTFCQLTAAQQANVLAFSNGAAFNQTNRNSFDHWLPSFNLKAGITPTLITRFAYSKAISRPGFTQLQNTTFIQPLLGSTPYQLTARGNDSNPNLVPVEADQFDLTAEWYFARVGSLTAAVFYKELSNIIVANVSETISLTNNGVTQDVAYIAPRNADGKGKVKGFEIAYQQSYDFLPGLLSGFGVQANYTFVDPSNIPSFGTSRVGPTATSVDYSRLPLEGLSRHTVNATAFYEKGPISIRAAYNWRSRYLLTIRDEIIPNVPIFSEAYGQLDGTILYSVNEHFKIGFQGVNLTDSITKTRSVINADGLTAPRNYFNADRRYTLTTRIKF